MAGVYILVGDGNASRIEAAAKRLTFFDEQVRIVCDREFSAAWVGHDDPSLFAPASDPRSGVHVITSGRVSWDESDWQRAERMEEFNGGLGNRLLLERFLKGGPRAMHRHNGPAALIVWDPRSRQLHLWTDHFGYHPVFLYKPDIIPGAVVATFADAIASDPSVDVRRDETSMAEFLSAWRVTPPHTFYRQIKYAGAALHCSWDLARSKFTREEYWVPHTEEPFPDIDSAAEELAYSVREAVRIRTLPRLCPVVSYTSGGMDSRAVLFACASPKDVVGLNLYDVPNREAAISKRLCEAAGVQYLGLGRDDDYYPRHLEEGARLSGAMTSQEDNHFLGTRETVQGLDAKTVITACTTDWLFKGYGLEKTHARIFGRNLPLKVFTHERINGFLPNVPRAVPTEFRQAVSSRLSERFSGTPETLRSDRDRLAVEDRRVRPACYAVSVSGQIMYRIFPYDTFLGDKRIADCYSRSRASWKLNADLWAKAVQQICGKCGDIEDANFGWRIGSSSSRKLISFARGWVGRRVKPSNLVQSGLATEGSWPNLGWYAQHSSTLKILWDSTPNETREFLSRLWGSNPWDTPLPAWSTVPNDLFRILTVRCHIEQHSR